jgi:YD repeat-containing protein
MIRKALTRLLIGLALVGLTSLTSLANVSLKNGNFFIGYTDAVYSGGFEPKIERVYNSKTSFKGIFGWGWGSEYELYLEVMGDGSVLVHEYGGGAENLFSPNAPSPGDLELAIEQIATAATQAKHLTSSEQTNRYKARLRTDAMFRNDEWTKYVKAGRLTRRVVEVGARFSSFRFSYQYVLRTATGYQRHFGTGRVETFDDQGRLTEITDKNNNWIRFTYGENGRWTALQDNFGRAFRFAWRSDRLLESITTDDGSRATFRYNDVGELVYSKDVDGNVYTFGYTPDNRHNLSRIGYQDGTSMEIAYHGLALQENVKSVKDRDGTLTEYSYSTPGSDRLIVEVAVTSGKEVISRSTYEYVTRRKDNGEEWTERQVTVLDGERTETVYSECCGQPVFIAKGADTTRFAYDLSGRVTYKETTDGIDSLQYHPSIGKVTHAVHLTKPGRERSWSRFEYDDRGNLIGAENSDTVRVTLEYDDNGRIRLMRSADSELSFKYNSNSKPIEIRDPKLGAILVTYKKNGEVDKVSSDGGREIALRVTSAFQRLLDLIRPAGVSLSF